MFYKPINVLYMKKLILTLLGILFLSAFSAFATDVTIDPTAWSGKWSKSGDNYTATIEGFTIELLKANYNSSLMQPDGTSIRIYSGAQLGITAPEGNLLKNIVFTVGDRASSDVTIPEGWSRTGNISTKSTFTVNNDNGSNAFTMSPNAQLRITKMVITYEAAGPITVANPTISNVKGLVTLDCTTTGATIKYHVGDAAVEAAECTEVYSEPFTVTKGQTVSAVASKEGANASEVVSQVITWETLPCGNVTTNPVAVDEDIAVERGTVITFSAENADALAFEVEGQAKEIVANPYEYNATADAIVTVTPIQEGAEVADKTAMFTITIKAAEACGEVVFTPESGSEITTGSTITATAANAVKYEYSLNDLAPVIVEGETLNITAPEGEGEYTLSVTPYNADNVAGNTATASYTIKLPTSASVNLVFNCNQSKGAQISGANASKVSYMLTSGSQDLVSSLSNPSNLCGGDENNGSRAVRFGSYSNGSYNIGKLTMNLATSYKITSIEVTLSTYKSTNTKAPKNPTWNLDINGHKMAETLTADVTNPTTYTISFESLARAGATEVNALTIQSTDAPVDVYSLKINYEPTTTGVIDVTVSGEGEVQYFNLQGVRVANPESGLYIRRQGNQVSKVYLR